MFVLPASSFFFTLTSVVLLYSCTAPVHICGLTKAVGTLSLNLECVSLMGCEVALYGLRGFLGVLVFKALLMEIREIDFEGGIFVSDSCDSDNKFPLEWWAKLLGHFKKSHLCLWKMDTWNFCIYLISVTSLRRIELQHSKCLN